jgi:16S rRNA (guanine527-N7)-methyltransferase
MPEREISRELLEVLTEAQTDGLIGQAPLADHVLHAAAFLLAADGLLPERPNIVDLGSGAGLPGLVLAELLPNATIVLVESRLHRSQRLAEVVDRLHLAPRVRVVGRRAELAARDADLRGQFDIATARGFGRPAVTAECAAPFLRVGGALVVSEPPSADESTRRWPTDGITRLGLSVLRRLEHPRSFVVLRLDVRCGESYPRRPGIPAKRPLF